MIFHTGRTGWALVWVEQVELELRNIGRKKKYIFFVFMCLSESTVESNYCVKVITFKAVVNFVVVPIVFS